MPRYEYIDHEGRARIVQADSHAEACAYIWQRERGRTNNITAADRAVGTVELSDERARSRR